jgi:hypothetical protein
MLSAIDYHNLMLAGLDGASYERMKALGEIERDTLRVPEPIIRELRKKCFMLEILFGR